MYSLSFPLLIIVLPIFFVIENVQSMEIGALTKVRQTTIDQSSYQATVITNIDNCGASIIDDSFVLTTARCVTDKYGKITQKSIDVVVGIDYTKKTFDNAIAVPVIKIYIPRSYKVDSNVGNIAVLKVNSLGLDNHPHLHKLKLPIQADENLDKDENFTVNGLGWTYISVVRDCVSGKIEKVQGKIPTITNSVNVTVITRTECQSAYKVLALFRPEVKINIEKEFICGQIRQDVDDKNFCVVENGSPLVSNNGTLVGVVSQGFEECNKESAPTIYTNVSFYLDFIQKVMRGIDDTTIISAEITENFTDEIMTLDLSATYKNALKNMKCTNERRKFSQNCKESSDGCGNLLDYFKS